MTTRRWRRRGDLRAKRPFVWNATNITHLNRDKAIGLHLEDDAFVEFHAIDQSRTGCLLRTVTARFRRQ
ncbi:MAG: hypothetical protein J2P53_08650 [Bradyrhizobiaceae bacterium]|nr:hypothetical protein [Bradyrhizobiaceae bacterium]